MCGCCVFIVLIYDNRLLSVTGSIAILYKVSIQRGDSLLHPFVIFVINLRTCLIALFLLVSDTSIILHNSCTKKFAFDLLDIGAYISASGVVTFKKSTELAETFKQIPENRILVETDAPYLAPTPLRGKPNEPSYIIHTVKFLSNLKNIPFNIFAKKTTENFYNLFGELN